MAPHRLVDGLWKTTPGNPPKNARRPQVYTPPVDEYPQVSGTLWPEQVGQWNVRGGGQYMGASNAMTAYLRWRHLPDRAFRALVYMALVARDDGDPPRYFAGREALIEYGLGRHMTPEPAPSDTSPRADEFRKARKADYQAAKVAIAQLVKAGVLECDVPAGRGRQAEYRLNLMAPTGYVSPTDRGRPDVPTGYVSPTDRGTSGLPPRRDLPTGGPQGGTTRNTGGNTASKVSSSLAAVMDYDEAVKFLLQFEDFGQSFIDETPEDISLAERVVLAASKAKAASA